MRRPSYRIRNRASVILPRFSCYELPSSRVVAVPGVPDESACLRYPSKCTYNDETFQQTPHFYTGS
jgi:hypothetical protein